MYSGKFMSKKFKKFIARKDLDGELYTIYVLEKHLEEDGQVLARFHKERGALDELTKCLFDKSLSYYVQSVEIGWNGVYIILHRSYSGRTNIDDSFISGVLDSLARCGW